MSGNEHFSAGNENENTLKHRILLLLPHFTNTFISPSTPWNETCSKKLFEIVAVCLRITGSWIYSSSSISLRFVLPAMMKAKLYGFGRPFVT